MTIVSLVPRDNRRADSRRPNLAQFHDNNPSPGHSTANLEAVILTMGGNASKVTAQDK